MHQLPALTVSTNNKSRVRTLRLGLRDQASKRRAASRISAFEEASESGAVVYALDCDIVGADDVDHGLEEGGTSEGADVAGFEGAACEEDGHLAAGGAVCELVFGVDAGVLAGLEGAEGDGGAGREGDEGEELDVELHGWCWFGVSEGG